MNTVILEVRSLADTLADAARAMNTGHAEGEVRIGFATPELLWQVLTAKRWELLKAMCGAGAMSIREAARRVGRDVKAVHEDVVALLNAGVLTRAPPMSPPHRCHELTGNRKGQLSMDLDHPYRLLFQPNHDPLPVRKEGGLDWNLVTAIKILEIEDTHG